MKNDFKKIGKLILIKAAIRIVTVLVLLVFVGINSHWSVTVFLTLAAIRFELEDLIRDVKSFGLKIG